MRAAGLRGITRSNGDKGVHYVAARCTQGLAEAGAVAEYVDRLNHRRLHGEIGLVPPAEFEDACCCDHTASATAEAALQSIC